LVAAKHVGSKAPMDREVSPGTVNGMRRELAITAAVVGLWAARRYYRNWGATKDESREVLLGDGHLHDPVAQTTAAEWIDAPLDVVWDELTRRVCGGAPRVGDAVRVSLLPVLHRFGTVGMTVIDVDAGRAMVLRTTRAGLPVDATCVWLLDSRWQDRTRLLMRLRIALRHPGDFLVAEASDPLLAALTRRALTAIRRSAEHGRFDASAESASRSA
jgi:hypothetical protein